jgi:hypothetical protein
VHEALLGFDSFHAVGQIGTPEDVAEAIFFLRLAHHRSHRRSRPQVSTYGQDFLRIR